MDIWSGRDTESAKTPFQQWKPQQQTARATTMFFLSNNIQQSALGIHQRVVLLLVGRLRGNRTSRPPKCQPCQSVLRHPPDPLQTFDGRTSASVPLTVCQRSPAAPRHRGVTCSTWFTSSKRGQLSGVSCPCISAGCCGTTCWANHVFGR